MTRAIILAALAFSLGYVSSGDGPGDGVGCPIYACRIDPKNAQHTQTWLTPAEWVILDTPNGPVQIGWDNENEVIRLIGREQQAMQVVGNVIDVAVMEDRP